MFYNVLQCEMLSSADCHIPILFKYTMLNTAVLGLKTKLYSLSPMEKLTSVKYIVLTWHIQDRQASVSPKIGFPLGINVFPIIQSKRNQINDNCKL